MQVPVKKKKSSSSARALKPVNTNRSAPVEEVVRHEPSSIVEIDGDEIQHRVEKLLKISSFEPMHRFRLKTRWPDLNATLGSRDTGIPYGKVIELSGLEHGGKTLLATVLMGEAQRDGAGAGYIDLEDSRDEMWATKLGVTWPYVSKFYPKLVEVKKGAPPVLQTAEQIFEEAERAMELLARRGVEKQFWFVDSIANITTKKQYDVGISGATMNSKLDRASFLSILLPRWAGLAANYNAMIFVSNQLRSKIGGFVMGDPDDTTGGKALKHACAIRARVRRIKGGRLKQGKKVVGLAGAIRNVKNKAGEGSVEGAECGFRALWNKERVSIEVMTIDDLKDEMGEEK